MKKTADNTYQYQVVESRPNTNISDKLAILSKYKADEAENKTLTPERTSEFEEARKTACDIAWKITVFDAKQYKINFKGEPTEEMKKATEDYVDRLTEYIMYNLPSYFIKIKP